MPSLTVRLLGPFRIWRGEELIRPEQWPTQKSRTLLAILLTERGHVVPGERLMEWLWPDLAPASAGNSLHVAVSQLRRLLEPELERPADSSFIDTRSGGYLFHAGGDSWIDVDAFWEAVARGQHWELQGEWGPAIASLRAAAELYHGDYLEEEPYEEWAIAPRERLREAYCDTLSRLAGCYADQGNYPRAAAACEKLLERDPVREGVYRQLMVYHYRQGQRDQALRAFERCRTALAETLGVAPMPQTRDLHERIVQGRSVAEPAERPSPTTELAQTVEKRPGRPHTLPMVGRDDELQALDDRLNEALAGRGHTVFIAGEAGAGKTRLAEALLARARARGVQVWRGKCHEVERDLPFQPVREALRPYLLRRLGPEQARRLLGPWAPQVAVLVPEIKESLPGLAEPEPLPPEEARQRLLEGLTRFCLSLAGRYPLVIFLDDVQWADPSTLQFLHRFARSIGEAPILLLAAYRAEEVAGGHPLRSMERSLRRAGLATRLTLDSLSPAAVASLVERKAAPGWDNAPFSRRLVVETEGNALFLNELLQNLLEEGHLVEDDAGRWRPARGTDLENVALVLPQTVQTVIESRYRGASDAAQDVLGAAAVIGHRFDYGLLERAGEMETATLLDALDELLARGLIQEPEEAKNGGYAFGHDKIREVVYEGLSRARRRYLHGRVAAGLEASHDEHAEAPAGRLAHHYAEAGRDDKALHYAILAGDQAAGQYAHPEAATHYNRALEIAERVEATHEQLVHLYTKCGRVLELDAQYGEALANYKEMEALARELRDRSLQLNAVIAQVTLYATFTTLFDVARAEELAERAIALARDLDDQAAEAKLLWNLSILYRNTMRLSQAIEYGERSLALARQLGLREQIAYTLHDLAAAHFMLGPLNRAIREFQEVSELWRELDNVPMLADSLAALAQILALAGDYEQVLVLAEEAFDLSASIDNVWGQANSLGGHIVYVYWDMGRPDKAVANAKKVLRLSEEAGHVAAHVFARDVLGAVYGSLGAVEQGLAHTRQALTLAETRLAFARHRVLGFLVHLHLRSDDLTAAEAVIRRGKEEAGGAEGLFYLWFRLAEGQLALRQGDHEGALSLIDDWLAHVHDMGVRSFIPPALHTRGQALLAGDEIEAAGHTLEKARTEAEALRSRRMLWQILAALAEVESRRGNEGQAERLRQEARDILLDIADHAPTPELRASFLARPDVRALLRER